MNNFVGYLNSLHCADANSNGALAESQAINPLFAEIQVPHYWCEQIFSYLTGDKPTFVILSGQAGDGKSTLALEIIKKIKGIPAEFPLDAGLHHCETLLADGREIIVVKDLSEWREEEREAFFHEALNDGTRSFLVVSNTGTLLNLFRSNASLLGGTEVEIEDKLLDALDSSVGGVAADFGGHCLQFFNLAQMDNVEFAMRLFEKMVQSTKWSDCSACANSANCPVYGNITLIQKYFERIANRLRLLLFRTYAYGNRLTMRQIGAMFAYMLTGGFSCEDVRETRAAGRQIAREKAAFYNRLWGDDGTNTDDRGEQLRAIQIIREQEFNTAVSPSMERDFWRPIKTDSFQLDIPEFNTLFPRLVKIGRASRETINGPAARQQVRRIVFFFYKPQKEDEKAKFRQFQITFLNSPMLLNYDEWRRAPKAFREKEVRESIFRVLQEQFCGITPPDGPISNWELYITLNRYDRDILQSAQIVLTHFKFTDKFRSVMQDRELLLAGQEGFNTKQISLPITLPFLDYIVAKKNGELGRGLQLSYRDRLQNLMADIIDKTASEDSDALLILKRGANGQLSTMKIRKGSENLEVTQ